MKISLPLHAICLGKCKVEGLAIALGICYLVEVSLFDTCCTLLTLERSAMSAIPMTDPIERIYTVKEVAEILRVSPRTVWRMIEHGELRGFKVRSGYRIRQSELEAYIKRQNTGQP